MKKLIAISVMIALVAGAAFADVSIGGNVKIGVPLLRGDVDNGDINAGTALLYDMHLNFGYGDSSNGGMMRMWSKTNEWQPAMFAFLWFTPIDMLRIQVGINPDADWGAQQIGGWGFNAEAQGGTSLDQHRGLSGVNIVARTSGFYGGFGDLGMGLSFTFAPEFKLNIGIPFNDNRAAEQTYLRSHINAVINLDGVGVARVSAVMKGLDTSDDSFIIPDVFASFYLTAIDGMNVDLGFAYRNETPEFGLGFRFVEGDITFRARAGFVMAENNMQFGIHVLPSFNMGDMMLFLNAGFAMNLDAETMGWFVNPYIRTSFGGIRLYAGFQLYANEDEVIRWSLPISFNVYL